MVSSLTFEDRLMDKPHHNLASQPGDMVLLHSRSSKTVQNYGKSSKYNITIIILLHTPY